MKIQRNGSQPSSKGSAEYFTGTVRMEKLFEPPAPARRRASASPSSPVRAAPGILIPSARR